MLDNTMGIKALNLQNSDYGLSAFKAPGVGAGGGDGDQPRHPGLEPVPGPAAWQPAATV